MHGLLNYAICSPWSDYQKLNRNYIVFIIDGLRTNVISECSEFHKNLRKIVEIIIQKVLIKYIKFSSRSTYSMVVLNSNYVVTIEEIFII